MTLTCTKCGGSKSEDDFYRMRTSPTGRMWQCKACSNEARRVNGIQERRIKREMLSAVKLRSGCVLCQRPNIPAKKLGFHHIEPKTKSFQIAQVMASKGMKALREEMKKCAVLCVNCHKDIHHFIDMGGRLRLIR